MSTALRLNLAEYDEMIARGAFDRLDRRIELIRGELREMNPAGPVHDDYIAFLTSWSFSVTRRDQVLVRIQSGLDLPELGSRPEPDVLWVRPKRYLDRHPRCDEVLLGIEVADSSIAYDRGEKADLYAAAGMSQYWVVDIRAKQVHVHGQPGPKGFKLQTTHDSNELVGSEVFPDAELRLSDLFA